MKKLVLMSLTVAGFALSAVGCASQKAEEPTNTMPASSVVSTQNNDAATVSSAPVASNDASSQSTVPQSSTGASDVATTMAQ
ncbi:hypothetical protein P256_02443 [Acinetobacter nectaris CIP 110549]|uniref:Uncharacterized protein n=1 Tax=Acinetobacter nectaris CIP 110549 TaxID=1392540 RepID=V2TLF7_9GAMM|nr:hypothetical protein [Acinetobacter nectaris]ESK36650.1 hypothetical protein P256_02443 [Acinetobacter nectaris CIP 110549]